MIWKPKEKDLTPDEAIALAKKELGPQWFGSTPIIAGVRSDNQVLAVPLTADFVKKSWLMVFADPTDFDGETAILFSKEWFRRFEVHGLHMFGVYTPVYKFLKNPVFIERIREKQQVKFPVVIDVDEALFESFKVGILPKVILHDGTKPFLIHEGQDWQVGFEVKIQNYLRSRDSGLPLLLPFEPGNDVVLSKDLLRLEFGFKPKRGQPVQYVSLGNEKFQLKVREEVPNKKKKNLNDPPLEEYEEQRMAQFTGTRPENLGGNRIFISGAWTQEDQKIITSDPNAFIGFLAESPRVSLIAQAGSKDTESGLIVVEVNQAPAYDRIAGEQLTLDDSGRSLVKLANPQLYHLLANLPSGAPKEVVLRFPSAATVPVTLYGLRFGN